MESAGQYKPQDIVPEAIKIMLQKIEDIELGIDGPDGLFPPSKEDEEDDAE